MKNTNSINGQRRQTYVEYAIVRGVGSEQSERPMLYFKSFPVGTEKKGWIPVPENIPEGDMEKAPAGPTTTREERLKELTL